MIHITVYNFIVLYAKHNSMKQGTDASITRNLNARQHYSYYFKDYSKYILTFYLNEENDLVVLETK